MCKRSISIQLIFVLALFCPAAFSQTPPKPRGAPQRNVPAKPAAAQATKVALASNTAPPGTLAVLPLYFTPGPGVFAGRIQFEATFPGKDLKFEKAVPGEAAKAANAEVTSSVETKKSATGETLTTLTVVATTPAQEGELPPQEIPQGVLATLSFRVSNDAKHGSIQLKTSAEVYQSGASTPVKPVLSPSAEVKIPWLDAPPSVTCFFFSH